ncbi:MAG: type II secretion system F family protein [Actinomycetia bacterium]|nr:type II secretion system F family protein [Actinomycetes bacterium]
MAIYNFKAKTSQGELIEDSMESPSQDVVLSKLRDMNYFVIEVREAKKTAKSINFDISFLNRIKLRDIGVFTRQFSTLISSGMSLIESLEVLRQQADNKKFSEIILGVRRSIESGLTLSESMARYPKVFSKLYISMISAGESAGVLDQTLDKLANFLEKEENIRLQIKNKTAYPKFVLGFAVIIMVAIVIFIVPTFQGIYDELGADLPLLTKAIIAIGDQFKKFYTYIIIIVLVVGGRLAFKKFIESPRGRYIFDNFKISMPKIGEIIKKIALARFTRILGTLISAGVPILRSLDIIKGVSDNAIIDNALEDIKNNISEGESISIPMSKYKVFTPMMVQMVAVGERSGSLDSILNKVADFYDEEVSNSIDTIITVLEPILLLVVAVMVAIIVLSLYLPLFNVYQYIS